ncbi:MAG: NAD-dependent succinate-semialdehyde dehydrogenase [Cytophaga sp.]|uniref:NAD-dependent succinate-semialdehyde dehydrogenase n=1 Tax=Cytophaga sp. TaxID=29535 RepID=UPI003F7E9D01
MPFASNPFTGEFIYNKDFDSYTAIHTSLQTAESGFKIWSNYSIESKKNHFNKLIALMQEQKEALAAQITVEMGKPISESIGEIEKCIATTQWYIEHIEQLIQVHRTEFRDEGINSFVTFEPIGTILGIMPWNFPFWQVFRYAIPTLFMGNTTLLKHAPNVQICAASMEKLFRDADFPAGVFQNIFASTEDIEFIIASNTIKAVTLTGSEKAGQAVAAIAGKHIKKCVLELGGSDPFIVLADAPISQTVTEAIKGRLQNNGQSCIAAKRFIIHEQSYDAFLSELASSVATLSIGDPMLPATQLGPIAREDLKENVSQQVSQLLAAGAYAYYTHPFNDANSNFFAPRILVNIPTGSPVRFQELFGPVFCCYKFSNEDEAIAIANETSFGLGASIWTSNIEHGISLSKKIESGAVFINDITRSDARVPFGGIKKSGYGRELSSLGLLEFVNIKTCWINETRFH